MGDRRHAWPWHFNQAWWYPKPFSCKSILNRRVNPDFPILDVNYKDATRNVEAVIQRVYEYIGMPLKSSSQEKLMDWERTHPIHRHGAHRYTLQDFDLTEEEINRQCPEYLEFYRERYGWKVQSIIEQIHQACSSNKSSQANWKRKDSFLMVIVPELIPVTG